MQKIIAVLVMEGSRKRKIEKEFQELKKQPRGEERKEDSEEVEGLKRWWVKKEWIYLRRMQKERKKSMKNDKLEQKDK